MKRIQVQLTGKRLDDVVDEMAREAARAISQVPKESHEYEACYFAVRQSIRKVLEKYVHAYDVCGLATVCHESEEIDPWALQDQDKD
jgi:hypothetical protein